ncbi:hypothetical protein [Paenibacillus sp. JNUCC32]|uniref:hypothetical protein n=1 Tax=Paenibacillus sp. JNUCC32 TaxID=2777984 RepID=UPI00225E4695|nr:hypothetical protein [Paenibacillus sp. JNUCC-32]
MAENYNAPGSRIGRLKPFLCWHLLKISRSGPRWRRTFGQAPPSRYSPSHI